MKIALDATPLTMAGHSSPVGGLARYTSQLIAALVREFPGDEFFLVSDQPFALPCSAPNLHAGGRPKSFLERRWWTCGLQRELKRLGADLFHGVNFTVPFPATLPAIMTIHDLSPWKTAPWVDGAWRARTARVRKRVPWMIRTGAACHIITPSEAIRREVMHFFHLAPQRVTAIPLAAAPHFRPHEAANGRPYFLYAGMLEPRKNVTAILDAWSNVRKTHDVDLVIAGPQRKETSPLPRLPGLKLRGVVPEDELAVLYAHATALVYPSLYEGFGLPVLEAMQCGTPAIISDDAALVETAGDAGIRVDLHAGSPGLEVAMRSLLDDPDWLKELRSRSLARAASFTWEATARETHRVYESMLSA